MAEVPSNILDAASAAKENLLPIKSKEKYEKAYEQFCEWKLKNNVVEMQEDVMLAFFYEKSKLYKASALWNLYSMIKSKVKITENIDIAKYNNLTAFLRRKNDTYTPKKSYIFTPENVHSFIHNAPDDTYLLIKVVLIFGLSGACRIAELAYLNNNSVIDTGKIVVVTLHDTKTKKKRIFTITEELNGYNLFKKYVALRPKKVENGRFFLCYQGGKCKAQPVGIVTMGKMPQRIADFLKLPDSNKYTGHCLRRTSATFLADSGVDMQIIKRHGGWRSNTCAEGYLEDSINLKVQTSKNIFKCTDALLTSNRNNVETTNTESPNIDIQSDTDNSLLIKNINSTDSCSENIKVHSTKCSPIHNNIELRVNDTKVHTNSSLINNMDTTSFAFINTLSASNCNINIYNNTKE